MTASTPISVLLPFRDAGDTLDECLASIDAQRFGDFEVLCIDDGSRDSGTALVADRAHRDPRFRLIPAQHRGLVNALNQGLRLAQGALIARMDADDRMHPERLGLQHDWLNAHPKTAVLGSRVHAFAADALSDGFRAYVDWQNSCVDEASINDDLYLEAPVAHPSVMFRRAPILAGGGYRNGWFPEDYELWLRLHHRGERFAKLPQTLLDWRDSPSRTSRRDPRCSRIAFDRLRARWLAVDERLLKHHKRAVVWGAGRTTRKRVAHLLANGVQVQAWIDIDPRKIGNRIGGARVHSPRWLARRKPRPFVLVYVANHGARALIDKELRQLGYRKGRDYLQVG